MKHTQGPWIYQGVEVGDEHERHICDVYLTDEGGHSRGANGCLIAAAPDMLAVCQKLVELECLAENDTPLDWDLLIEATALAREVIERMEQ